MLAFTYMYISLIIRNEKRIEKKNKNKKRTLRYLLFYKCISFSEHNLSKDTEKRFVCFIQLIIYKNC
jgi:hypothetical protein